MKISYAGYTHRGNAKTNNEDNFYLNGVIKEENINVLLKKGKCRDTAIFAVSDGIGGEAAGEKAAFLSMSYLKNMALNGSVRLTDEYANHVNVWLCSQQQNYKISNMGCTLVAVKLYGNKMDFLNLGDSRLYLLHENRLHKLSEDHTEYTYLKEFHMLPKNAAALERSKHTLTQHLGVDSKEMLLCPQTGRIEIWAKDKLLLCSDGISDMLEEKEILSILKNHASPEKVCILLVDRAMKCGKTDNLTAIVVSIE